MSHFAIQGDGLDGAVCLQDDGATRGFVAAAGLHAHVAVFHQVQTADAVLAAQLVQLGQHVVGSQTYAIQRHDIAFFELYVQVFGFIRCRFWRHSPAPHGFFGLGGRVFQVTAFEGDVQQVGVHGIRRATVLVLHVHRNAVFLGVGQQLLAGQQVPLAPWGNHFYIRLQAVVAQLETHLVVTLAGSTVRYRVGAGEVGDFDLALGDQRAGDGGAQQVLAFVNGVGAEHREHEVAYKLFAQVIDEDVFLLDAELQRLLACRLQLFALAQVGGEGHHFALIGVLQPLQDHRSIQATGIGQYHFIDVCHRLLSQSTSRVSRVHDPASGIQSGLSGRACGFLPRPIPRFAGRRSRRPPLLHHGAPAGSA